MFWRKWLVRALVFGIVGLIACAAYMYQYWTNPQAVRRTVIAKIQTTLPNADVKLETAHLRLFGGIALNELRVSRRDHSDQTNLLYVPSGILYHDKEKLLEGSLSLRKIELKRPRLHFVRQKDGTWNLQGLIQTQAMKNVLPTVVVDQGTLVIEDRSQTPPIVAELNDLNLTIINDPIETVTIQGTAQSELLGELNVQGHWNRTTQDIAVSINAKNMQVTNALVHRLAAIYPTLHLAGLTIRGHANLTANLHIQPGQTHPVSYKIRCNLQKTEVDHPRLPLPLKKLKAEISATNDRLEVVEFNAISGNTKIHGRGAATFPSPEKNFDVALHVDHLPLEAGLFKKLPEYLQKAEKAFTPRGPVSVHLHCAKENGEWVATHDGRPSAVELCPEGIHVSCRYFPYPLDRLTGNVDLHLATNRTRVDVVGYTGNQPVHVKGYWKGRGIQSDARLEIQANNVPIDEKLISALPDEFQKEARSFHATGKCNLKSHVRHLPGHENYFNTYHAYFHDVSVKWDRFPLHVTKISGYLDVFPSHYEFHDFRGQSGDGTILLRGATIPKGEPNADNLILHVQGRNIALNDELKKALSTFPGMENAWDSFQPSGHTNCTIRVEHSVAPKDQIPPADPVSINLALNGGTIKPLFFPYAMHHVKSHLQYDDHRLEINKFVAWHNGTKVSLQKGIVDFDPNGGYYAQLLQLRADDLRCTEGFSKALPRGLRQACASLHLHDPIDVSVRKVVVAQKPEPGSPPDVYWDGRVVFPNVKFKTGLDWKRVTGEAACVGRHDGNELLGVTGNILFTEATVLDQPFRNVHARFHIQKDTPEVLNIDLQAPLFEGDVTGQVRVEFHSILRYEMNLTASQINLVEFGKHNLGSDANLKGLAVGRLHLSGKGDSIESMEGNGSIDVPRGRLHNLPLMLDLMKAIGFRGADRTMFEEAHAEFGVHGSRVEIRHLQMMGNIVSLTGKGTFKLDGTDVKLDFYPSWARVEQLLPQTLRPLPTGFTKNLLKIEARGRMSSNREDLKFHKKPVPVLLDPLWNVRNRIMEVRAAP